MLNFGPSLVRVGVFFGVENNSRRRNASVAKIEYVFVVVILDVDDVKFVINFDFPNSSEDYVHRIGRTGR